MRSSGHFVAKLGAYFTLLIALLLLWIWLLPYPGLIASKILIAILAIAVLWQLWRQTQRTNVAVARFVSALEHGDFTQTFRQLDRGSGFDELGNALDRAMRRLRQERADDAIDNRFAAALVDEAPTPLLAIDPAGIVRVSNKTARRLFGTADGRRIADVDHYGASFSAALDAIAPGQRRMCRVTIDGLSERATVACAGFDRDGARWRILSVQIIQNELDAAEIATQSDLVRVLTHEIMNSITPVTSLAATAAALIAEVDRGNDPALADARMAVDALAKRANGMMHFVDSYREFSTAPSIAMRRFAAAPWLAEILRLFEATPQAEGVTVTAMVHPQEMEILADADLLAQVLLNLLKNGAEAARAQGDAPRLSATIGATAQGRTRIVIADNGAGVPDKFAIDIFLPFFTTKRSGTGVGLSFARQIVLLHHGSIELGRGIDTGASFEIIF